MKKVIICILLLVVGVSVSQAQARDLKGLRILESGSGGINAVEQKSLDSSVKFKLGNGVNSEPYFVRNRSLAFEKERRKAVGTINDYIGERKFVVHPTTGNLTVGASNITQSGSGKVKISDFVFQGVEIEANLDLANGTVSIPPCQFALETEGVKVYLCRMDIDKRIYSTTDAITGVIDNGNIYIESGFGFFVIDGAQEGAYLKIGFIEYCDLVSPNSTMTNNVITYSETPMTQNNRTVAEESYWVNARQVSDNEVRISPVKGRDASFDMILKLQADGSAKIEPQPLYSTTMGGSFNFYKMEEVADENGTINISAKIMSPELATVSNQQNKTVIDWGKWCVGSLKGISTLFESSKVSVDGSFTIPSQPSFSSLEGEGTKDNPYLIKSFDDYKAFVAGVNYDSSLRGELATASEANEQIQYYPVLKGKYVRLDADLDFNNFNEAVMPIAASDASVGGVTIRFEGEFDGNGHSITGFKLENYPYDYAGFFGYVGVGGVVKNLKFISPEITSMGYNVAVVVGKSNGLIDNVDLSDVKIVADAGYNVAAIAGNNFGTVQNCDVDGGSIASLGYMGGISGRCYGNVFRCNVNANIAMSGEKVFVGGIAGYFSWNYIEGVRAKLQDCSYGGLITTVGSQVAAGGIAGETVCADVERCFAQVRLLSGGTRSNYIGGVIGTACNTNITDCYASGLVSAPNVTSVSGILGHNTVIDDYEGSTINKCYSSATVIAGDGFSKNGIAGDMEELTVTSSYFDKQMAGFDDGVYGKTTAEMTSANGLEGFDKSVWSFVEGTYPRLKNNGTSDIAAVSVAALSFGNSDSYRKVTKEFRYSQSDEVEWKAYVNKALSDKGGYSFTFENGVGKLNGNMQADTIFIVKNKIQKVLYANIAPIQFEGEGTESSPWLIGSKKDLQDFCVIANKANIDFEGNFIKMTADIDLEGESFDPICKDNAGRFGFLGSFDGDGHAVHNLRILTVGYKEDGTTVDPRSDNSYYYGGLFGNIGASGVVKNLVIAKDCKFDMFMYGGAIAGSSIGLIENCENYADVKVYFSDAGGMVGKLNEGGIVRNCYNAGDIYAGNSVAGGLVGTATEATIENSVNAGNVGAVYINPYQTDGKQSKAGGIVAVTSSATVKNVLNTGKVSSYKIVGGIVGSNKGTSKLPASVSGAVNYGLVDIFNDDITVGQIAGENTYGNITDCYFDSQLQDVSGVNSMNPEGTVSCKTSELISGSMQLDNNYWKQVEGSYPVLSFVEGKDKVKLASMSAVVFSSNNKSTFVSHEATLQNSQTVNYSLKEGSSFGISGNKLTVTIPEEGYSDDVIIASYASLTRELPIRTLNASILEGEGTQESPYLVKTADDMLTLGNFIKTTGFDYDGSYFKVVENLDFKDKTFEPVAYGTNKFSGNFDGGDKVISNISYSTDASDKTAQSRGLFGVVGINGVISNVVLDETNSFSAYTKCGGIAGTLYGKIIDCTNKAAVSAVGSDVAGGIAGYGYPGSSIENSSNSGSVSAKGISAAGIIGASLSGSGSIVLKGCTNSGDVIASKKAGGIAGSVAAIVSDCNNSGDIVATNSSSSCVGGIMAEALLGSSVSNCNNSGSIAGDYYVGGIVGQSVAHTGEYAFKIENCENTADILIAYSSKAKGYCGGIAGQLKAGATVINCVNKGNLTTDIAEKVELLGGIVGDIDASSTGKSQITDCHNEGKVVGYRNVGGIAGRVDGDADLVISGCYNIADLATTYTTANTGGIVGTGTAFVTDCWNSGNISGNGKCIGGITGNMLGYTDTKFERNANFGNVTGSSENAIQVAGLIGYGRPAVRDCYNFGNVSGQEYVSGILGNPGNSQSPSFTVSIHRSYNAGKLTMVSADNGGNIGNAVTLNSNTNYLEVSDNWFDTSVSQKYGYDGNGESARAIGLAPAELCALRIDGSDAFDYGVATYPSLKNLADNEINSFYVARMILADGDTESSVTKNFKVGTPKGAVWTASSNLILNGNDVKMANQKVGEEATLTLTVGDLVRTYNLVLAALPLGGVDSVVDGKNVVSRTYYNFYGIETIPEDGEMIIEKLVFEDGSTTTSKILYKEK